MTTKNEVTNKDEKAPKDRPMETQQPRRHDDAQVDKRDLAAQQKVDEQDVRVDRAKVAAQSVERQKLDEMGVDEEKARLLTEKPFDYIERTRPEDPSGRLGQQTRDNVNPNIPSGNPGDPPGPLVDPNMLGMPQGGVAPMYPMEPENPIGAHFEDARYDELMEAGQRRGELEQKYHEDLKKLNADIRQRSEHDREGQRNRDRDRRPAEEGKRDRDQRAEADEGRRGRQPADR